jgi:hypothetical protein
MMLTIDAEEAWWPPTFTPEDVWRTLLAWWTMLIASHSTRRCTASSTASRSTSGGSPTSGRVGTPADIFYMEAHAPVGRSHVAVKVRIDARFTHICALNDMILA